MGKNILKKTPIAKSLIVVLLVHINCVAQELPADFADIIDDNPTDASLTNFLWMLIMVFFIMIFTVRKFVKFNIKPSN